MSVFYLTWNRNLSPVGTLGRGDPQQQQIFLTRFWYLVRQAIKRRQENNPLPRASKRSEALPWLTSVHQGRSASQVSRTIDTRPKLPSLPIHQHPWASLYILLSFPTHTDTKDKFSSSPLLPSTNSWRVFWELPGRERGWRGRRGKYKVW